MANINITQGQLDSVVTAINNRAKTDVVETKTSAMSKAQFNALAEERKANRAGSGFDEWGKYNATGSATTFFGSGASVRGFQNMIVSSMTGGSWDGTFFSCFGKNSSSIVSGIRHKHSESSAIRVPTAPNIYPYDTVLTTEQINSGVIKHADASNSGLIVNGKFDVGTSGWTALNATLSIDNGRLKVTNTTTGSGYAYQSKTFVVGKKYIIEFQQQYGNRQGAVRVSTSNIGAEIFNEYSADTTGVVTNGKIEFTATAATLYIGVVVSDGTIGNYRFFDNIAVYPADAISRSDLVFLESWHEDVSEKNMVYPLGNVQYLGSNTDGLTGIADGSFSGYETYSLFGNWQTSSALIGKGYVWSSLTEAQKKAFIANPENNCYLDGDKVIQVRYRVRVVQGLGDNTNSFNTLGTASYLALYENGTNSVGLINARGKKVSTNDTKTYAERNTTGSYYNISSSLGESVIISGGTPTDVAYEGKCYALPIALVHR